MGIEREHRKQSLARRDALVRAAVVVLAERGTAGVTHKAVTTEAGLPLASVSYFWPSIDALTDEAVQTIAESEAAALADLTDRLADAATPPEEMTRAFAVASAPTRPDTLAQFEAYLAAARHETHRPAVTATIDAFRSAATASLRAGGLDADDAVAAAFVSLSDGFALHQLARGDEPETDLLERAFRALLVGHLALAGQTDQAMALAAPTGEQT